MDEIIDPPTHVETIAAPSNGSDPADYTVTANQQHRIIKRYTELVAGGAAANRYVVLTENDGTNDTFSVSQGVQTAGQTVKYWWGPYWSEDLTGTERRSFIPGVKLDAGCKQNITTTDLQGADQWGVSYLDVQVWYP